MLKYLKAASAYLLDGTLLWRLPWVWRHYVARKRLAWWESQVGRREWVDARIQRGVRMRLFFDSHLAKRIYCEYFEWAELQFLNAFLRSGDVFVDIGANTGLYTLIAAHRVGDGGYVHAFEPSCETYQRLLTNVLLNRVANVYCHRLAISDRTGEAQMAISLDGFDAFDSLAQPIRGNEYRLETITCTKWDTFAVGHGLVGRVTMMKIDVEGWESRVLGGGYDTLRQPDAPVLQVEFCDETCVSAGTSCTDLYRVLEDLGYQVFAYESRNHTIVPAPLRETYPYVNLIAAKDPEQVVARLKRRSCLPRLRGTLRSFIG
jgi:FkbM family methyltransferase